MCQHRLDEGKLANAWGNAEVPPQESATFLCLQEMDSNVLLYDAELSCVCRPSTLNYVMKRSAHLHVLVELAEEVLLQAVAQVGCKAAAAVDAESCRQRLAQRRHERIPLPLRHNALRSKPYLKKWLFRSMHGQQWLMLAALMVPLHSLALFAVFMTFEGYGGIFMGCRQWCQT